MDTEIQQIFEQYDNLNLLTITNVLHNHRVQSDGSNISTIILMVMESIAHLDIKGADKRTIVVWAVNNLIDEVSKDTIGTSILKSIVPELIDNLWAANKNQTLFKPTNSQKQKISLLTRVLVVCCLSFRPRKKSV